MSLTQLLGLRGLLANTKRIFVFSTIHTAFNHPIVVAKQMATVDQISKGPCWYQRSCWLEPTPNMKPFGMDLPQSHDDRYALAQEWLDVLLKIWTTTGKFDWDGRFFKTAACGKHAKAI